jgi:DNA polymerase
MPPEPSAPAAPPGATPPGGAAPDPRRNALALLQAVRDSLDFLGTLGVAGGECPADLLACMADWGRPLPPPRPPAVPSETLAAIREDLGDCRRCPLAAGRTHIVFGSGAPRARLVFVGEGPGAEEDRSGEPFVGAAGQLLTRIIAAITLSRDQVYICNVVKCRPPGNRTPQGNEIAACSPFLQRQLAAIRPEFVVALGAVAARCLLATEKPIGRLRGRLYPGRGYQILATYHPAFLLRNPEHKRAVWQDMQLLMRAGGLG